MRRGSSLVGLLVTGVIVLLLVLAVTVGPSIFGKAGGEAPPEREDGLGETIVGRSMLEAKDTTCQSNLGQVRAAIQINTDPVEDTKPADLASLRLGSDFEKCPIGKEPYRYDPASGVVSCPQPGHEKF
jgi:hypothetical protein